MHIHNIGTWSNYPYFPSGNIAVQSIEKGLFMVKVRGGEGGRGI
jgi:hypothetical protein